MLRHRAYLPEQMQGPDPMVPIEQPVSLRIRGYGTNRDISIPDGASPPKKDIGVQHGMRFTLHQMDANGNLLPVGEVFAMHAAEALQRSGYKLTAMNRQMERVFGVHGVDAQAYGSQVGVDMPAGILAVTPERMMGLRSKPADSAVVSRIGARVPMKRVAFKMGDPVTDGTQTFLYLFRVLRNGTTQYVVWNLEDSDPLPLRILHDQEFHMRALPGAWDPKLRTVAIQRAYDVVMSGPYTKDIKQKMDFLYRKFIDTDTVGDKYGEKS